MALQPGSLSNSDATGTTETITLEPVPPATSTAATIASAFYGTDDQGAPLPVQIAGDGKSMSFTVVAGVNPLVITLVSPDTNDEIVQLSQDGTVLANPVLSRHKAVFTMFIKGT